MKRFNTAEEFIEAQGHWQSGLIKLREVLLQTELEETIKWGFPVYTINNKNVAGLGAFKGYFGLWFFQGVFLTDPAQVLMNAQDGKTKGMRQWRFSSAEEIDPKMVLNYVEEAIQNQKEGKEIQIAKAVKKVILPPELKQLLAENKPLQEAFGAITPGRQREYAEYIETAKRAATKTDRLEKIKPLILAGVGLNDKYK